MSQPVDYLDASVVVPLLVEQPTASVVHDLIRSSARISLSSFGFGEAISAISRLRRMDELDSESAATALKTLDGLSRREFEFVAIEDADIRLAGSIVRRFDLALRLPDAIHVAIVQRLGYRLATFDQRLAAAARAIGIDVLVPA